MLNVDCCHRRNNFTTLLNHPDRQLVYQDGWILDAPTQVTLEVSCVGASRTS